MDFTVRYYAYNFYTLLTRLQWWWLGQVAYVLTCMAAKVSIAMTLLRLTFKKIHNFILWSVIAVTIAVGFAFWFVLLLQCNPVSHFWNRLGEGTCIDVNIILVMAYIYSISAAACDFTMGVLPIILVSKLHMNSRTKWALAGILSMGCVYDISLVLQFPGERVTDATSLQCECCGCDSYSFPERLQRPRLSL
jgi:cation-transporting ATPase 13A1